MGVSDDRLSAGEQNELRALVTAGAGRMRAARRRRMQAITGGAAVVLVAAVVGAVVLTAVGSPDRIATPIETTTTPSPTPDPTPTEDVPPRPVAEVAPFGGSCEEALGVDRAAAWMGAEMRPIEEPWTSPEVTLSGGLHCLWAYPDSYVWGSIEVVMFPAAIFPTETAAPQDAGTCDGYACRSATLVDGLWIHLAWSGDPTGEVPLRPIGATELGELTNDIAARSLQYPAARPASADGSSWGSGVCERLAAEVPAMSGVTAEGVASDLIRDPLAAGWVTDLGAVLCSSPLVDETEGLSRVAVIPGGGRLLDAIAASEGAQALSVTGADAAVTVPDNYMWERHFTAVIVRAGDNLLLLYPRGYVYSEEERLQLAEVAAQVLQVLDGAVG